jgi:hypothetical protein
VAIAIVRRLSTERGSEARAGVIRGSLMGSWRKAYGALKDSTRVGLAKVNSDFKVNARMRRRWRWFPVLA